MSRIYDNWERLLAAVLRKQQLWQMFHDHSRTPSLMSSVSSDFSSSFRLNSPLSNASFDFEIPKDEFSKIVRSIENENVARLRGYYLSKDEMLGVYDYFPQGSVQQMLHGKGGENQVRLDWESRVGIAISAAKGLAHMHKQSGGKFVHGNIKASDIFLHSKEHGCLGDHFYADFQISEMPRYPNFKTVTSVLLKHTNPKKEFSQASDVYSYGELLIELLSGISSTNYTGEHKTLANWARHKAIREWTALVFDTGILEDVRVKKEALDMLEVALSCVKKNPKERPNMKQVVEMLHILSSEAPIGFFRSYRRWTGGVISY